MSEIIKKHYLEDEDYNESVELIKKIFKELGEITKDFKLNYVKSYMGVRHENSIKATNFISFTPRKHFVRMACRIEETIEKDTSLKESGLEKLQYNHGDKQYEFVIRETDWKSKFETIRILAKEAKEEYPFK